MSDIQLIHNRIANARSGSAFIVSDFLDLMDYESAKKNIARLEKSGSIRRVIRGVYDKPIFSKILQQNAVPNPNEIAAALARNYNWKIAPTGSVALNQLGLSTQVPADWTYISSGPYKRYDIGTAHIQFLHRADRDLNAMSPKTMLCIQAIKELGKDRISDSDIQRLRNTLTNEEKKVLMNESMRTTTWVYGIIKKICTGA